MSAEAYGRVLGLEAYGAYFTVENGIILSAPMLKSGAPETTEYGEINWYEVTVPDDQELIDTINEVFKTTFTMEQFAGR